MKKGKGICRFAHQAMGTIFELLVSGCDKSYARQASQAVFAEVDRIESLFSRFNPSSEIGQINLLRPGEFLRIGVETFQCLQTALWAQSDTNRAFDINVGSLLKYKEKESSWRDPSPMDIMEQMELSRISGGFQVRVRPLKAGVKTGLLDLDLGGIGKGYALDRSQEILSDWEIDRVLIHGGTSTALAIGSPPETDPEKQGWAVGIGGDWTCPQAPREFYLKDRALSGSGTEVKGEHVFDPRTGRPAQGHQAAWVSHPSAAAADALSTAFMVMTTEEVKDFCDRHLEVWALVVIDDETCQVFNPKAASKQTRKLTKIKRRSNR
jgi:thiamine biosynthesis lipoprotein